MSARGSVARRTRLRLRRASPRACRAFTLIEVLVALAVLAVALVAAVKAVDQGVSYAARLRERTLAQWIAQNEVATLQLAAAWPDPGVRRGVARFADARWRWTARIAATADDDVRRVEVAVADATPDATPLVSLTAFLPRPQ